MTIDLAARVHDHSFRIDPIIRTLLDTDFYKLLMLQIDRGKRARLSIGRTPSSPTISSAVSKARPIDLEPVSLVCKVFEVGGRPAVKLSDNPAKCLGPADEERYSRVFGYQPGEEREARHFGVFGKVIVWVISRCCG